MNLVSIDVLESSKPECVNLEKADPDKYFKLFDELKNVLVKKNGLGIAGVQTGINEKIMIFKDGEKIIRAINPVYYKVGSKFQSIEGCLSYPEQEFLVKRYKSIHASFITLSKNPKTNKYEFVNMKNIKLNKQVACIFQHETDHCNGISCAIKGKKIKR